LAPGPPAAFRPSKRPPSPAFPRSAQSNRRPPARDEKTQCTFSTPPRPPRSTSPLGKNIHRLGRVHNLRRPPRISARFGGGMALNAIPPVKSYDKTAPPKKPEGFVGGAEDGPSDCSNFRFSGCWLLILKMADWPRPWSPVFLWFANFPPPPPPSVFPLVSPPANSQCW